jgi:hypothetical protein
MAIEGQNENAGVVDGGASPPEGATKPEGQQVSGQQTPKVDAQAGNSTGQNEDYERRFKGITADLQKERAARQRFEKELEAARAETASERKRVQALAGLEPKSTADVEDDAIRQKLEALGYPRVTAEDLEAIKEFRAAQQQMQMTTEHYWVQHGRSMVQSVYDNVEKELGGKLSERQQKRILSEYVRTIENDPELVRRHEAGDKTLAAEIAKQLSEDFFEPIRRKSQQSESQRYRPVPSGKERGIVTTPQQKIDVNDPKAVEDFLVKGFRERNGEFSGRR